jgi:hypothetical protein
MPPGSIITMHRLLTKDLDAMTGECAVCGPVRLRWRSGPRKGAPRTVACPTPKREERERTSPVRSLWLQSKTAQTKPHGLTVGEAREFCRGKVCAVCGSEGPLVVDHDHATGKIREPLCHPHNLGLGQFSDDPALLRAAAAYLERHSNAPTFQTRMTP